MMWIVWKRSPEPRFWWLDNIHFFVQSRFGCMKYSVVFWTVHGERCDDGHSTLTKKTVSKILCYSQSSLIAEVSIKWCNINMRCTLQFAIRNIRLRQTRLHNPIWIIRIIRITRIYYSHCAMCMAIWFVFFIRLQLVIYRLVAIECVFSSLLFPSLWWIFASISAP